MLRQAVKFGVSGVCATATHLMVLVLLVQYLGVDPVFATPPAFLVAFAVSYTLNYLWTFRSSGRHLQTLPRYFLVAVSGMGLNAALMFLCTKIMEFSYLTGFIVGVLIVPWITFLGARMMVFYR